MKLSVLFYFASDMPLEEIKNPKRTKSLPKSLNEKEVTKFTYDVTPCVAVGDKSVKIAEFSYGFF